MVNEVLRFSHCVPDDDSQPRRTGGMQGQINLLLTVIHDDRVYACAGGTYACFALDLSPK